MHQSGHSRAHSVQTVQFSSTRPITPRLRGGSSGSTSGYSWVVAGRNSARAVVASPRTSPRPGPGGPEGEGGCVASTASILPCRGDDARACAAPVWTMSRAAASVDADQAWATTTTVVSASCASATGTSTPPASRCSWSSRSRGHETRSQMTTTATIAVFASIQSGPSTDDAGPRQPARNSTATSAESTTMPAYSASRNSAKRSPEYSVYGPTTSSESAIGMSNGGRWSSARPATSSTKAAGACHSNHHGRHASAIPTSDSVPAAIATLLAASTSGSSYASNCAAERMAPSSAYLFALAQPAISVPRTPTALAASTNSSPASRSAPTRDGDSGIAVNATR